MEKYIDYMVAAVDEYKRLYPDGKVDIAPVQLGFPQLDITNIPIVFDDVPEHIKPSEFCEALSDVFKDVQVTEDNGIVTEVKVIPIW